jgi:hypothetical protein
MAHPESRLNLEIAAQCVPFSLSSHRVTVVRFLKAGEMPLTWWAVAEALSQSPHFRQHWHHTWAEVGFDFQWKPIPLHPEFSQTHPFFAVLVPATFPPADATAYREYLQDNNEIAFFPNLSGDAQLLIPPASGDYGHMAAFCRGAPADLYHVFWAKAAEIVRQAIERNETMWCNTHGHGVPWFHLRCDRTFKYIAFPPRGTINRDSLNLWYHNIYDRVFEAKLGLV